MKETLFSIFRFQSLVNSRSLTCSTGDLGWACSFWTVRITSRPTINRLISCSEVSAVLYTPMDRPPRRMVMRSVISLISFSLWEMKMMVYPCSLRWTSSLKSSTVSWVVSTAVGSSRIRILAPRTRAFKISTFCFMPTGMSMTLALGSTSKLNFLLNSSVRAMALWKSTKSLPFLGSMPRTTFSATVRLGTSMKC